MHHGGKKGFVSQTYRTGTVKCGTRVMAHQCIRDDTINYLEMTYINHKLRAGTIGAHKWFSPSSPLPPGVSGPGGGGWRGQEPGGHT